MTIKEALEFGLFTILGSAIDFEDGERNDNGDIIYFIDEVISGKFFRHILQDFESYLYYIRITPQGEISIEASNEDDMFVLADYKRIINTLEGKPERLETLKRMITYLQEIAMNNENTNE